MPPDDRAPDSTAAAYSVGGRAWAAGPSRIYTRLAELLVAASPVSLSGRLMCDVGAGTGIASRTALAAGAAVIATDLAPGMLAVDRSERPAAVVADATSLPFSDDAFGGIVAAYCYNHLEDPVAGFREARRVTAPGGVVLASAYAQDDTHPVKEATERSLVEIGWTIPDFHIDLRGNIASKLATVARAEAVVRAAGLRMVNVEQVRVPFPELTTEDLIEWRLGMPHTAWFVTQLAARDRAAVVSRTSQLLGADAPTLVRSVIHITAVV